MAFKFSARNVSEAFEKQAPEQTRHISDNDFLNHIERDKIQQLKVKNEGKTDNE